MVARSTSILGFHATVVKLPQNGSGLLMEGGYDEGGYDQKSGDSWRSLVTGAWADSFSFV